MPAIWELLHQTLIMNVVSSLSANVALAVNPEFDYVKVNYHGENIVLGKDRLKILKEDVKILDEFSSTTSVVFFPAKKPVLSSITPCSLIGQISVRFKV